MSNSDERRQAIYDKIKGSSKEAYILSEMKRLGFWNEVDVDFERVNTYIKKESELSGELSTLVKEKKIVEDPEVFLASKHRERKAASKLSQKETKIRREERRKQKAANWASSKSKDIVYLGRGYSHQLDKKSSDAQRLKELRIPVLHSAEDLAKAMNTTVAELRFLAFSRKNSKISHYQRFHIQKKTGGVRLISAPMPRLKTAQNWILENILNKLKVHEDAHGCVVKRSIKTNASPHIGQAVVINQDIKNFFPSIDYKRIKGMYMSLGYSPQVATILGLICSEPRILDVSVLGEQYYAQRGERFLPQGAPTSPMITNIICRKLDYRLAGLGKKYGFTYTRYVDDITFSTNYQHIGDITKILKYSKRIVKDENFVLHPEKLRIMKCNGRQEVTGVVVNEKSNIAKNSLKRFRALLFQIEKDGIKDKYWTKGGNVLAQIDGYANFIFQINPEKGVIYKERVAKILEAHNYKETHRQTYKKATADTKPNFFNAITKTIKSWFKR